MKIQTRYAVLTKPITVARLMTRSMNFSSFSRIPKDGKRI